MNFVPADDVAAIRNRIDHPIVDGDGHLIEFLPLVRDFIVEDVGEDIAARFDTVTAGSTMLRSVAKEQRRQLGVSQTSWWAIPTRNTLDRATAMLPGLMYQRLDELGFDYALLYPTYGLTVTGLPDAELRQAMARACNRYAAEVHAPYRDRLEPVASIPMFDPAEAIAELNYAVGELGLKAVMMAGVVPRRVPGLEDERAAKYIDGVGHDSVHDYDPVWQRCVELGVAPTFHAGGMGWGSRISRTNYVHNHIGNFAAAGEATCRSLVFGGVPKRFPELRFGFQEGGVAWAVNLLGDLLGHYDKRNRKAMEHYNPANLDRTALSALFAEFAAPEVRDRVDRLDSALTMLSDPDESADRLDEFAESGIESAADIAAMFSDQFAFGCEADDPMNALAFRTDLIPTGKPLRAIFASDIGHWDVPDFKEVLPEAWELVDDGHLDAAAFREFTFGNAVDLFSAARPDFFDGTVVADAVRARIGNDA